jgi:hypothetical protein
MKRGCLFFSVTCCLLCQGIAYAQFNCGFDLLRRQKMHADPTYRQSEAAAEASLGNSIRHPIPPILPIQKRIS